MKKTVIHFVYSDIFSGLERVAANIIKNLPEDWKGYYAAPQGEGIEICRKMGIDCIPCDTHSISDIKRVIKEYSPDAVHAHDPHISLNVSFAGVPYVAHLHNNCPWMKGINVNSLGLVRGLSKAEKVFCVSPAVMDDYIFGKLFRKKTETLYNIIDSEDVENKGKEKAEGPFDVCFVGRFTDQKQPQKFVELVSLLKESLPDIKAVMVGDGELYDETVSLSHTRSLENNITFTGFCDNPFKYMNASKVSAVTSWYEGFGLVAVEAMVLGLPVVCFSAGGIDDIVSDENGKICADISVMKDEVLKLLSDRELYEKKSQNAKVSSERYTDMKSYMDTVIEAYLTVSGKVKK